MATMAELGCTGEFGCDCPKQRKQRRVYVHGSRMHYERGCRCPLCVKNNSKRNSFYRKKKEAIDGIA